MRNVRYEPITDFDINTRYRDYEWSMNEFHYHNAYEIYYLLYGQRKILVQDRIYEINAGDIMLFKPNVFHRSISMGHHKRLNIEFTMKFMNKYFSPITCSQILKCFDKEYIRVDDTKQQKLEDLLFETEKIYMTDDRFYIVFAQILKLLCELSEQDAGSVNELSKSSQKLTPIIEYINSNYTSIENIDEIAEQCYINKSYMCRLFKKEMGITLIQYINNIKIQQACELLRNTDMTLTDIGTKCGFSNASYFSAQFKKELSITPSEFRRKINIQQ